MKRGTIIALLLLLIVVIITLTTCHFIAPEETDETPEPSVAASLAPTPSPEPTPSPTPSPEPTPRPIINQYVADAIAGNPDIVGHLVLPDTNVDYMVVHGEDNDFYLNHTPDKVEEYAGSIFLDYRCQRDFSNGTTVVYGHNMKNGSMFNHLMKYGDKTFFDEHPEGYFYLPDRNIIIEIFAALMVDHENEYVYRLGYREDHLEYIKENARQYRELDLQEDDHFITMSTCAYEFENARMVIIGRIVYEDELETTGAGTID